MNTLIRYTSIAAVATLAACTYPGPIADLYHPHEILPTAVYVGPGELQMITANNHVPECQGKIGNTPGILHVIRLPDGKVVCGSVSDVIDARDAYQRKQEMAADSQLRESNDAYMHATRPEQAARIDAALADYRAHVATCLAAARHPQDYTPQNFPCPIPSSETIGNRAWVRAYIARGGRVGW